jgi:8-oxo-dGTP diphosphatase
VKRQPAGATFPCARCGRPLTRTFDQHPPRIRCPRCRFLIYDYPRLCSGMVVVKGDMALLLRRGHPPKKGHVDIPGGFVDAAEGIDDAARRELKEETALTVGRIEHLGSYWDRYYIRGFGYFPTYNVYYLARWRSGVPHAGDDAASAEWVPIASLGTAGARYAWRHMRGMFADLKRRLRSRRVS